MDKAYESPERLKALWLKLERTTDAYRALIDAEGPHRKGEDSA